MTYQSVNPNDGKVSRSFEHLNKAQLEQSGYGRELGNMGIQEFVNKKLVRTAHLDAPA